MKDDFSALEIKKAQGYKELQKLINESNAKLKDIHQKEKDERKSLEESETSAIEQRRKNHKMDTIRVQVTREELDSDKTKAQEALEEIESKVREETQESQQQRQKTLEDIDQVDREIQELEAALAKKRAQKEELGRDLGAVEAEIDVVRSRYADKIEKHASQLSKLETKVALNDREAEENVQAKAALEEYEASFAERMAGMDKEIEEINEFSQ